MRPLEICGKRRVNPQATLAGEVKATRAGTAIAQSVVRECRIILFYSSFAGLDWAGGVECWLGDFSRSWGRVRETAGRAELAPN
jgi:hypothetical protein